LLPPRAFFSRASSPVSRVLFPQVLRIQAFRPGLVLRIPFGPGGTPGFGGKNAEYMRAMIISLGPQLPEASSNLPGGGAGHPIASLFGLAPGGVYLAGQSPDRWCALTAPFHPCSAYLRGGLHFCGTCLRVTPTGRYPAPCPVEPGLSSPAAFRRWQARSPGLLAHCSIAA